VFFVLSGYLITGLLLAQLDRSGRVDLPRFYMRRLARLTPALVLMLAVYLVAAPVFWPGEADHLLHAVVAGSYLADYGTAFWGVPSLLSHTWSLAGEMHF
jgi:peptidoglycan/LPS O-acetylase OafA/YrhL